LSGRATPYELLIYLFIASVTGGVITTAKTDSEITTGIKIIAKATTPAQGVSAPRPAARFLAYNNDSAAKTPKVLVMFPIKAAIKVDMSS
jgi:hypothetical protein